MPVSTRFQGIQEKLGKQLTVLTGHTDGDRASPKNHTKFIQVVSTGEFRDKYNLGKIVLPSTHQHMETRFARRKSDGMDFVVKLRFKPGCFKSKAEEREWRRSTQFMLNLPNSCGVAMLHEVLEDNEAFYIVMEKAEGADLLELLHQEKRLPLATSREIIGQLLEALSHFHESGCIHKDLKLENIVVEPGLNTPDQGGWTPKSVKLIDFDTVEEWTPKTPPAKDVLGTDQYIAQEAYAGQYSPLSDMFALGVIAYHLLAGKFPFRDEIFNDKPGENWVGSPKMKQIQTRLKHSQIDWSAEVFVQNPAAKDLVQSMLSYNKLQRPTATQALQHPWLCDRSPSTSGSLTLSTASSQGSPKIETKLPQGLSMLKKKIMIALDV